MLNDDFVVGHPNPLDHQPQYLPLQFEAGLGQLGADPFTKAGDCFGQRRRLLCLGDLHPHDLFPLRKLLLRLP